MSWLIGQKAALMVHRVLDWLLEEAHEKSEEFIGLTITILALLTAAATLVGHRTHTDEIKLQTLATDQWGFYQAKHIRAHMYGIEAEKALASSDAGVRALAKRYLTIAVYEQCGEPAADTCNLENCRMFEEHEAKPDAKHSCNVPVLKDSPELLGTFFQSNLLPDKTFRKRFLSNSNPGGAAIANAQAANLKVSRKEPDKAAINKKDGAADILDKAQSREHEVDDTAKEALLYDISEIILETSIVICGVAILLGTETYRKFAYLITITAVAVGGAGVAVALCVLRYPVGRYMAGAIIAAATLTAFGFIVWVKLYLQEPQVTRVKAAARSNSP